MSDFVMCCDFGLALLVVLEVNALICYCLDFVDLLYGVRFLRLGFDVCGLLLVDCFCDFLC